MEVSKGPKKQIQEFDIFTGCRTRMLTVTLNYREDDLTAVRIRYKDDDSDAAAVAFDQEFIGPLVDILGDAIKGTK